MKKKPTAPVAALRELKLEGKSDSALYRQRMQLEKAEKRARPWLDEKQSREVLLKGSNAHFDYLSEFKIKALLFLHVMMISLVVQGLWPLSVLMGACTYSWLYIKSERWAYLKEMGFDWQTRRRIKRVYKRVSAIESFSEKEKAQALFQPDKLEWMLMQKQKPSRKERRRRASKKRSRQKKLVSK